MIPSIIILAYLITGLGILGLMPSQFARYPLWQLLVAALLWPVGVACGVMILIKERTAQ